MARKTKPTDDMKPNNALRLEQSSNETGAQALARKLLEPEVRHALAASAFAGKALGGSVANPGLMDFVDHMQLASDKAESGDIAAASRLLMAQALTLDSMFTELARRAAINMGDHINAAERYGRLALKAQSNCRATLDTLGKLHQPREQTVRHVHVNEGGQAVIADQFHHHAGGMKNAEFAEQPHATGTSAAGSGPAMLGHDAEGGGLPISSGKGPEAVPNARRDESGSA